IAKEERDKRVLMHKIYLVLMVCHGVIRNRWCNDYQLLVSLRRLVSPQIMSRLDQDNADVLDNVKSRRFLDGLQMILKMYSKRFRVKSKGLIRKNWNELSIKQDNVDNNITFNRFKRLVCNFTGSRDLGAQGFVALLRSIGLNCRLVFSLQPPDYTLVASFPAIESSTPPPEPKKESPPSSKDSLLERLRKANTNNSKANMLLKMRSNVAHDSPSKTNNQKNQKYTFPDSDYPVFWCEVWNKYNSKWVSIDPVVKGIIEQPPMRRKSSFEPPYTDPTNQATYVLAYDKLGGIKDVTRRYSQYFNARTVKKRIGFRSDEDQFWYTQLLRYSNSSLRRDNINKIDVFESKEFYNRDLSEGMPNSLNDFKNHPIYAIESQLRQNEIIYPKDDTSKCGTFRNKGRGSKKGEVIPVYKRSHVYLLRSAKAWYMRGRVLKIGVQPFKTRRKAGSIQLGDDDDEEDIVRLYAEFQTQLYIPPPIVDGQIPKNAYKNIDIYTPTMIPENGAIIETTGKYTMRMAERAAKYILEIDYAKAIIAFDFGSKGGGKNRKGNRMPTAREGGILIDKQFEEAMYLVLDCLVEEEETRQREDVELNSLRNWKYFLTKLRITERLN
ncbi:Rad4-domain-containing protein, partial [Hyphopichia burtonii NRRL Y-1933]